MGQDESVAVDAGAEWWTTTEVADYLGVRVGTISSYRQRGQMPPPDRTLGRTHLWRPSTITQWQQRRARMGDGAAEEGSPQQGAVETASAWRSYGERSLYDNEWVRLSLVDVELPDGRRHEHHVVSMKPAAMMALLDDAEGRVLLMWRHRFASDVWNWELPGGLLEPGEDPAVTAAPQLAGESRCRGSGRAR